MFLIKINKHDKYVEDLVKKISSEYDVVSTHQVLERKKRVIGEIDIVARRGDKIHLFEVKCSYRISKARRQLNKFKKLLKHEKTSCFFYFGEGNVLIEV